MHGEHFIEVCVCGNVLLQCRCATFDKTRRVRAGPCRCLTKTDALPLHPAEMATLQPLRNPMTQLRDERDALLRERDELRARVEAAEAGEAAATARCKYEVKCGCMLDSVDDVCLTHSPAIEKLKSEAETAVRDARRAALVEAADLAAEYHPWPGDKDDQWNLGFAEAHRGFAVELRRRAGGA